MPSKAATAPTAQRQNALVELFQSYVIPPSPLHEVIQNAAKEAGWVPPWEREDQKSKKRVAGKRSGMSRRALAQLRQSLIHVARAALRPNHRLAPYSNAAVAALREQYDQLIRRSADDPDPVISGILSALSPDDRRSLAKASDDTLLRDLKAIRRMRGIKRSG